jgi:uncharacterized protein
MQPVIGVDRSVMRSHFRVMIGPCRRGLYEGRTHIGLVVRPDEKRGPTLHDLRARREEILRLAAAHRARNVRLFGSVAHGEADICSDLDILVDLVTDAEGFAYFGLLEDLRPALTNLFGHDVDIVDSAALRDMRERVLREALPLMRDDAVYLVHIAECINLVEQYLAGVMAPCQRISSTTTHGPRKPCSAACRRSRTPRAISPTRSRPSSTGSRAARSLGSMVSSAPVPRPTPS